MQQPVSQKVLRRQAKRGTWRRKSPGKPEGSAVGIQQTICVGGWFAGRAGRLIRRDGEQVNSRAAPADAIAGESRRLGLEAELEGQPGDASQIGRLKG